VASGLWESKENGAEPIAGFSRVLSLQLLAPGARSAEPLDRAAIPVALIWAATVAIVHVAAPAARTIVGLAACAAWPSADDVLLAAEFWCVPLLLRNYDDHGGTVGQIHGMVEIAGHARSRSRARLGRGVAAGWRETRNELAKLAAAARTRSRRIFAPCSHSNPLVPHVTWATLGFCWCSSCSPP